MGFPFLEVGRRLTMAARKGARTARDISSIRDSLAERGNHHTSFLWTLAVL
jgi:hypothetical protein